MGANPGKEQVYRVECGRGVRLDNYGSEITVSEKVYTKTRTTRLGCGGTRVGPQADAISRAFSARNASLPDLTQSRTYSDPISSRAEILDPYGFIYLKLPKCPHYGVDVKVPVGTEVRATNKGIVALVARNFKTEGNMIILNHGGGVFSVYMHLSKISVKEGSVIGRHEIIGLSGKSCAGVREPHLHFNIRVNDVYVDPVIFIDTVNQYFK